MKVRRILCLNLFAVLLSAPPAPASAGRASIAEEIQRLEVYLLKAQTAEGSVCVPELLAEAQVYLARAKEEFEEGDYWEAEDAVDLCRKTSENLWDKILVCGEDLDRDGVPDSRDRCPDDPETYNGYQDSDGCPDRIPRRTMLTPDKIELLEPLRFDEQTQELLPADRIVLEDVATLMKENPEVKIRIEAHVDSTVAPEKALSLCRARTANVKDALVALGVEDGRLETAEKGSLEPIAPNDSEWGRMLNRRIEFVRIP